MKSSSDGKSVTQPLQINWNISGLVSLWLWLVVCGFFFFFFYSIFLRMNLWLTEL